MTLIGVTGATGALGGRVARRLAGHRTPQRLIVRDAARAPQFGAAHQAVADYGDAAAMRAALVGVDVLLLVSATETEDRVARHLSAVESAAAAGVGRIVYISFLGASPTATFTLARHHWQTEEAIRASGMAFTFLRDSLYQDVLPYFVGADGVIRGPAGEGRVSLVARDDIADVATAVLLDDSGAHDGKTYNLTGPQALSLRVVADILSRHTGREVSYYAESLDEAYASRAEYGAPDWMVEGWVTSYAAIAVNELEAVSDDVARVSGHPAQSFDEFLTRNPDAIEHVRRTLDG